MSNELQAASSLLPITDKPVDKVDQTGENNFFIENHADIHFHVNATSWNRHSFHHWQTDLL